MPGRVTTGRGRFGFRSGASASAVALIVLVSLLSMTAVAVRGATTPDPEGGPVDCAAVLADVAADDQGSSRIVECAPEAAPDEDEGGGILEALFGGIAWLFGASSDEDALPSPAVASTIPLVRGLPAAEAFDRLRDAGLQVTQLQTMPDLDVDAGLALETQPPAGGPPGVEASVVLVISTGPAFVAVPDIVGLTVEEAEDVLFELELDLDVVDEVEDEEPEDTVIDQLPMDGELVRQGSTVEVVLSAGPPLVTLPDLAGRRAANAVARLQGFDLVFDGVSNRDDPDIGAGRVIRTRPAAGAQLEPGSPVLLVVSRGPAPVLVPDLVGARRAPAIGELRDMGLQAGDVQRVESTEPRNTVLASDPPAGVQVRAGSRVGLTVSGGGRSVDIPAVRELRPQVAYDRLTGIGLDVTEVRYRTNAFIERGRAVKTDPGEAAEAATGSPVVLTISRGPREEVTDDPVAVPAIRGLPTGQAINRIIDAGLAISAFDPRHHANIPLGAALRTAPSVGSMVPMGSSVALLTSLGPRPSGEVPMPNVRGRRAADAVSRLERDGLRVGAIQNRSNDDLPAGTVIRTAPPRGTAIDLDRPDVVLFVSTGPAPTTVPDVVGSRRRAARNELSAAGLQLGNVSFASSSAPANTVVASDPPAGAELPAGRRVNLILSAGGAG